MPIELYRAPKGVLLQSVLYHEEEVHLSEGVPLCWTGVRGGRWHGSLPMLCHPIEAVRKDRICEKCLAIFDAGGWEIDPAEALKQCETHLRRLLGEKCRLS